MSQKNALITQIFKIRVYLRKFQRYLRSLAAVVES